MASFRGVCLMLALGIAACDGAAGRAAPASATSATDPAPPAPIELPSCRIGTMVGKGGTACVPVGPSAPDGFKSASDDWGFRAVNPWGLCPDRFLSAIGFEICMGIDHACPTDFVPAGATLVHDQAELVAALATTAATIALADGTYEPIVVERDVTLVGRCPERVVLRGTGSGGTSHAIEVRGAHSVSLRSLTIQDAGFALWASDGAKIAVERALFSNNGCAAWIQRGATLKVWHALIKAADTAMADGVLVARGGHAELAETELRDMHVALQAFGDGSTAKGSSLVISDRSPEPMSGLVIASHGGNVEIDGSLIFANDTFIGGASETDVREVGSSPAKLRITNSELLRVHPTEAGGFNVSGGSTLELVNDTFETRARVAISAQTTARVLVERTVIRPVLPTDPASRGVGAGLVIDDGVALTLDRSAILGVSQSAIMASRGCHIRAVGSLIADVWEYSRKDFGKRFESGQAISLSGDAALELSDSALVNNAGASIWMDRGGQTSVKIERSLILATRERDRSSAVAGLLAWSGTVDIRDSLVHGIVGTALGLGDVTGAVVGTTISRDDVGFRFLGKSRTVVAVDADQRPRPGEILTRDNVPIETPTIETEEPLPLGDCRCEKSR